MITLHGYASVFDRLVRPINTAPFVIQRGAYNLAGASIRLCVDHDESRCWASTNNRTVRAWQDAYGLAFEADIDDDDLEDAVRSGRYAEVSAGASIWSSSREMIFAGERAPLVSSIRPIEFSLVRAGGCPGTGVWTSDAPPEQMHARTRVVAATYRRNTILHRWREGQASPSRSAAAGRVSSHRVDPPRQVPASVSALLAAWAGHASRGDGTNRRIAARMTGLGLIAGAVGRPLGYPRHMLLDRLDAMAEGRAHG